MLIKIREKENASQSIKNQLHLLKKESINKWVKVEQSRFLMWTLIQVASAWPSCCWTCSKRRTRARCCASFCCSWSFLLSSAVIRRLLSVSTWSRPSRSAHSSCCSPSTSAFSRCSRHPPSTHEKHTQKIRSLVPSLSSSVEYGTADVAPSSMRHI